MALNMTRSEAVKRGRSVTLCASNAEQNDCDSDWTAGWLMVLDDADPTDSDVDVDEVLQVWDVSQREVTIDIQRTDTGSQTGASTGFVRYMANGTLARINNEVKVIRVNAYAEGCVRQSRKRVTVGVAGIVNITREECESGD